MQLTKLYGMQKVLMDRIDYKGKDRFDKTILALLVEISECANEHRGFKYWSKRQLPTEPREETQWIDGRCYLITKNPLLEEYVDGLHFVLQIGIELGYEHTKPYSLIQISTLDVFRIVYKCVVDVSIHKDAGSYEKLLSEYLSLGYHLGFKNDDIYDAYVTKNEINHIRQESGY